MNVQQEGMLASLDLVKLFHVNVDIGDKLKAVSQYFSVLTDEEAQVAVFSLISGVTAYMEFLAEHDGNTVEGQIESFRNMFMGGDNDFRQQL